MSIFDRIKNAIFGEAHAANAAPSSGTPTTPAVPQAPDHADAIPAAAAPASSASPAPTPSLQPAGAATPSAEGSKPSGQASVDVAPILDAAVKKSGQKLDWKHSIVDLMKALGMDATLEERKELAAELDYRGDIHDSAAMNTFLHKALLQKLSQNGGKVPAELLD